MPHALIQRPGTPFHIRRINTVIIFQDTAHPKRRCHLIFRHAHNAPLQVAQRLNPAISPAEEAIVPKGACHKNRDRRVGAFPP